MVALRYVLAPVRQRVVGHAVEVVDDALEYVPCLEEAAIHPGARLGLAVGIRDERRGVGAWFRLRAVNGRVRYWPGHSGWREWGPKVA